MAKGKNEKSIVDKSHSKAKLERHPLEQERIVFQVLKDALASAPIA